MGKLLAAKIRSEAPLTETPFRGSDPLACCNLCGVPAREYQAWREHDERDQPIPGDAALVFLGTGPAHIGCRTALENHPRLYAEERGNPGHFPRLCSRCAFRDWLACTHPDLKANGGAGLSVGLDSMAMVVCVKTAHGSARPLSQALSCKGQTLPGEVTDAP